MGRNAAAESTLGSFRFDEDASDEAHLDEEYFDDADFPDDDALDEDLYEDGSIDERRGASMNMAGSRAEARTGGFTRSAGAAAGRGVLLIVFALAIGVLLLSQALDDSPGSTSGSAAGSSADESTADSVAAPPSSTVSTTVTAAAPAPTVPAHAPAEVTTLVLNGRSVSGVAGRNSDALAEAGYNTLTASNLPDQAATVVYYSAAEYEADAALIAEALGIPAAQTQLLEDPASLNSQSESAAEANVIVVLGTDGGGIG
ncbi:MAG: LytR C-terminal domain-containing protein [Acidimicrobiia bacterium]|nr:LytR C-terminal domain-containing protein [Acidimicrobiia bacterium]